MNDNLSRTSPLKKILRSQAFTLLIMLVLLVLIFSFTAKLNKATFFKMKTLISIMQDLAVPGFLAIGAGCLILSGGIDISVSAVGAMSGVILAVGISWWGIPWYFAVLIAIIFGALVGFLNAVFVNELGMQPFIATLAMMSIIRALMIVVSTKADGSMMANINFKCDPLDRILNWEVGGVIPGMVIVVLLAFLVYGILLKCTKFGREVYMLGGNPVCARLCGVNARRISYTLYINCSVLGAISGIIYATRSMQGSLTALSGDQFTGLTAAVLGGISFMGGSGGMGGTLIGLLVLKTFNKGMLISGGSTYLTSVLSGVLLIVALTLDVFSRKRQQKRLGV
jgi:ribose/xylose/arabinose/galactoside ABC-type transport system permease subunit